MTARNQVPAKMTLRERQMVQTREHLLATAGSLFGEKGYGATSIDDIVGAAGTSRATLYAYFDGKEAVLSAIVEKMWQDGLQFYEDFGSLPNWSRGTILDWLQSFAAAYERDASRNKAAAAAAPGIYAEAPDRHRQMVAAVRRNRELWRDFTDSEADVRASMVVDVVDHEMANYFLFGSPVALDVFLGYLADGVRSLLVTR
jgi:AcrR family transcriptional regulator